MPYNYMDDPRFQRALLSARARSQYGNRPRMSQLAGGLQADMMQRRLQFRQLGLQKQMAEARLAHSGAALGLGRARLGMAQQQLREEGRGLDLTMALGMGTALYSGLEGRRRAKKTAEMTELQKQFYRKNLGEG